MLFDRTAIEESVLGYIDHIIIEWSTLDCFDYIVIEESIFDHLRAALSSKGVFWLIH